MRRVFGWCDNAKRGLRFAGRLDADALHAAGVCINDFNIEPGWMRQNFAALRQARGERDRKARSCVELILVIGNGQALAEFFFQFADRRAAVRLERAIGALDHKRRLDVVFVINGADNLFDEVFHRDETVGAAVFIDNKCKVNAARLHAQEKPRQRHRLRHEENFSLNARQ